MHWSVAVFAHNEERSLSRCLDHIMAECTGHEARVHVVVNGATDASSAIAREYASRSGGKILAYSIRHGDKSNAWNQYIHTLKIDAPVHLFVDAYAFVKPHSFSALAAALKRPGVNAATAVPDSGRSKAQIIATMRTQVGLHGSLHALAGQFIARVREKAIRLPLNLYRGDGLIGAMAAFDLEPLHTRYDASRIAVVEDASWRFDSLQAWRWRDIRRELRRRIRQLRGRYESAAFKGIVKSRGFEALPALADDMIAAFIDEHGLLTTNALSKQLHRLALKNVRPGRIPTPVDLQIIEM